MLQAAAGSDFNDSTAPSASVPAAASVPSAQQSRQLSIAGDALLAAQLQNEDQVGKHTTLASSAVLNKEMRCFGLTEQLEARLQSTSCRKGNSDC